MISPPTLIDASLIDASWCDPHCRLDAAEFEADRGAAALLGNGDSLARALQRIEVLATNRPMQVAPQQAYAYIHNPLSGPQRRSGGLNMAKLFSTHPATEERIRRLRSYAG